MNIFANNWNFLRFSVNIQPFVLNVLLAQVDKFCHNTDAVCSVDHCNILQYISEGHSEAASIQNVAAWLEIGIIHQEYIISPPTALHWLPINFWMQFKLLVFAKLAVNFLYTLNYIHWIT